MKLLMVLAAGTLLVSPLLAQSPTFANGWSFWGTEAGQADTSYTRMLPNGASDSCQLFGYFVRSHGTVLVWRKNFGRTFRKPNLFLLNVRLNGTLPVNPANDARFWMYFGNADTLYPMGSGIQRWFILGQGMTSWWYNMEFTTTNILADTITRVALKFSMYSTPDGAEFVLNDLRCVYGPYPWYPDSIVVMDGFGAGPTAGAAETPAYPPSDFVLAQNFPNPFNASTRIWIGIPQSSRVSLKIYDVLGREVANLMDAYAVPGNYEARWDGSSYSSGTYICRLVSMSKSGTLMRSKRMILQK